MEMPSHEWLSDLGLEDSALVGQFKSKLAEPTAEQLEALMGYQSNFVYKSDTSITGYPTDLKLPMAVSQLGVVPSGENLSSERPAKQSKPNNSWYSSSFHGQQLFSSKVSTLPSIYVPSAGQIEHQQLQNHFTNGDETYESVVMAIPHIQEQIVGYGGHDQSGKSNITGSDADEAFNVSYGQFFQPNHVASDMRITDVTAGNRNTHSNHVPIKASGNSEYHIIAERKRREKLSQRFIALSAIVPGLKKMDKASVLSDAINYVKQLHDTIKALKEQAPKDTVQSVVYLKKTEICNHEHEDSEKACPCSTNSSSDKDITEGLLIPEIETRVVHRNVFIHIHCEKRKHLLLKLLAELENLQLKVVNASILSFSETTFDLAFNAQMEEACDLTVKVIAKALQDLFKKMT